MTDSLSQERIENSLKKLKQGCFLLATKGLADPNFQSTLVLVCRHTPEGSYGLVLNRVSHMPRSEIFNSLESNRNELVEVHLGGPVQESQLQIVQLTEEPAEDALKICDGVYLGGVWSQIEDIFDASPGELWLFLGYSGWGGGQLEYEVKLGGWEVLEADPREILGAGNQMLSMDLESFKKEYFRV